jgi:hypothetical protein
VESYYRKSDFPSRSRITPCKILLKADMSCQNEILPEVDKIAGFFLPCFLALRRLVYGFAQSEGAHGFHV